MALGALSQPSARYEAIAADGSRLAAHATVSGVHTGEFFGVAATGKTVSWQEVHLFEVRDRRIAGHWMDAALLAAYLQMTGQGQPDGEPPRARRRVTPAGTPPRRALAPQVVGDCRHHTRRVAVYRLRRDRVPGFARP